MSAISIRTRRILKNRAFLALCLFSTSATILILALLIVTIMVQGSNFLFSSEALSAIFGHGELSQIPKIIRWDFLTNFASRFPEKAGIYAAVIGSLWVCLICALLALPLGIGTAIYLEEFAPKNRWTALVDFNIRNLACPALCTAFLA